MMLHRGLKWAAYLAVGMGMGGLLANCGPAASSPATPATQASAQTNTLQTNTLQANTQAKPEAIQAADVAPATQPTTAAPVVPATQPTTRPVAAIRADLMEAMTSLRQIVQRPGVFTDPKIRADAAPTAVPLLKKAKSLLAEYAAAKHAPVATTMSQQFDAFLVVFGDADTTAALTAAAAGTDPPAEIARNTLRLGHWIQDSTDAAQQGKILDGVEADAKAHPDSDPVTVELLQLPPQFAADDTIRAREGQIFSTLTSPMAKQIAAQNQAEQDAEAKAQADSEAKLHSFEGKPLVIAGTTVNGKAFTTADWKGKVILVDFWATWCPPCRAELPRVEKAYADFHAKGLEVLGVSNDQTADVLKSFVAADPGMPWPQLFDPQAAATGNWNPTTLNFGINGIPTMFLIDKKGVLRTVDARENFEDLIPKMLAE